MGDEELRQKEEEILQELEEYHREREQVKELLGKIGGKAYGRIDMPRKYCLPLFHLRSVSCWSLLK